MKKKLWLAVYEDENIVNLKWMVEVDLNKPFKFVELRNRRMGFTQIIKKWWEFWK